MGTSSKALAEKIEALASSQGGFFTAGQAADVGYADSVHNYHVQNGDWLKVQRGIYRLGGAPEGKWSDLHLWALWSKSRNGKVQGVYSHETALAVHGVIKRANGILHMTVPSTFRRNSEIPKQLKLYKADLAKGDYEERDGVLVTTLERTKADMEEDRTNPKSLKRSGDRVYDEVDALSRGRLQHAPAEDTASTHRNFESWEEPWDGPTPEPLWSDGRSFDEALQSGED